MQAYAGGLEDAGCGYPRAGSSRGADLLAGLPSCQADAGHRLGEEHPAGRRVE